MINTIKKVIQFNAKTTFNILWYNLIAIFKFYPKKDGYELNYRDKTNLVVSN